LHDFLNLPANIVMPNAKFKDQILPENWSGIHPFEVLHIKIMGRIAGAIFTIHPLLLKKMKIKGHVTLAIIDLSTVENKEIKNKMKYTALPKYPSSTFDCTVVVTKEIAVGEILACLKKLKMKELASCELVDIFPLNDSQKSVTLRTTFLDLEKTLDGAFLNQAQTSIIQMLEKSGYPLKTQEI